MSFHKLDVQVLPQKLELEKCITSFLLNDKVNYAKTGQNKLQRLLPLKSLNRVQAFMKNVEEVLKFLSSPVAVGGKSEILVMNLNGIVGELIFNSGLQPDVVENLAKSVNLNFVHSLTVNCLPKIYIHQPINTETDRNVLNRFYNCLDDEQLPLNEAASLFTLDDKCQLTLNYVQTTNETIAYLLSEIFNVPLSQEHSRLEYTFFKNLMLSTRVETNVRSALYSSKAFAALSFDRIAMSKLCDLLAQSTSNPNGQVIEILENITEIQYRQHSDILNSIKDSCLLKIIFNPSMSVEKYAYISKITDYNVRADTVLKCLVKIKSVDLAERLIKDLLVTLSVHKPPPSAKSAEYREKLQSWHENIVVYKSIAESIENNYNWIDVMEQSTNNPENILQHLLERKQYQLCLQWTAIHPLRELKQRHVEILEKFSSALLVDQDTDCNPVLIKIIESSLPHQRIIEFYDNLILTSEWKNLQLLNDFLKYAAANKHSTKICPKKIQKYKLSLVIFEIVGEGEYKGLWKLINKPLLIIEQYLMNSKFAVLARIIEQIRPIVGKKPNQLCKLCNVHSSDSLLCLEPVTASKFMSAHKSDFITTACVDTLIRIYAATALDFRVAEKRSLRTSSSHNTTEMSSLDSLCDDFVLPKVVPKKENWVDDYAVTHCMCCKRVPFTMLTRRHHCRRCGRVVCHSCSTQRLKIPEIYSDILVRCCDDCYRSTELALKKTRSPRTINTDSMFDHKFLNVEPEEDEWILSGNTKYDCLLRDEFVYEYAPSVSLCLSICAFHSTTNNVECVNFLLLHCRKLQSVLGPIQAGIPNPEVDYVLVTKMLNCLILATKVRGGEPNECNAMIDYAEIITSVVQNGCQHLLQIEPLDSSTLRRLCDSLVRADKWKLALELSLKCGFPITGIKASWGVSCLKAGCYATAREKLSYCMQKIDDENLKNLNSLLETTLDVKGLADVVATKRPLKSPPLLLEVLKVLESNRCDQQKPELMKRASSITSSNLLLATQKMKRKENIPMNEPALSILDAISNLKQITKGVYTNELKTIRSDNPMLASFRDYLPQINITKTRFYEESMYYLISYGCHSDIVRFLMKNKLISYALKYILLQKVDPSTFIHVVFMPNVKQGNVASIIDLMTEIDETMLIWRDYITQTCRYLEVNRLLNTLYQLQNLLQDPIRASMTSVKFYSMQCSSFLDLQTNTFHLINAKKHLQSELELCNWEEIKLNDNSAPVKDDSLSMKMDLKTLNGHINTINRQIEIVKFLAACEQKNGADAMRVLSKIFLDVPHLPTLFGKVNEKIQLAVLTLVCGKNVEEGFGLSFRIIQDFNLNSTKIYGLTAKYLASSNRIVEVEKLMECIKSNDADKEPVMKICDEIACLAVKTAIETYGMKIKSSLDNLIKSVCDTETKVQCFIWLGQLKSAYLLAVQHNRLSDVKKILRQAEKTNQPHIKRLCEKKLNLNTMCHTHVRDFLRY